MNLEELGLSEEQLNAVKKAVQSEADKVRTDYSTKLKTATDELEKLKPKDKTEEEKSYEDKLKELAKRENEITAKERTHKLREKLTEKGIPAEMAQYLNVGEDMDKFVDELSGTVNGLLLNNGFKPSDHKKNNGVTKEQFAKMTYAERAKLADEKPELYKILSQKD